VIAALACFFDVLEGPIMFPPMKGPVSKPPLNHRRTGYFKQEITATFLWESRTRAPVCKSSTW
jgi:hypothetical protein